MRRFIWSSILYLYGNLINNQPPLILDIAQLHSILQPSQEEEEKCYADDTSLSVVTVFPWYLYNQVPQFLKYLGDL